MSKDKGKIGEDVAVKFLATKGFKILKRNYRYARGEIDIIAMDGDILVFVEVKMRYSNKFGTPEDAITFKKRKQLRKIAEAFIQTNEIEFSECRFDVIGITLNNGKLNVNHIENAF